MTANFAQVPSDSRCSSRTTSSESKSCRLRRYRQEARADYPSTDVIYMAAVVCQVIKKRASAIRKMVGTVEHKCCRLGLSCIDFNYERLSKNFERINPFRKSSGSRITCHTFGVSRWDWNSDQNTTSA